MRISPYINCAITCFLLFGCGTDPVEKIPEENATIAQQNVVETGITLPAKAEPDYPKVKIEELDHSQEFFKEQHTTSFSYLPRKNWTSFTATKDGLLTKLLLYGKANLLESPHYGLSMSGFVREKNPDTGPKFGKWNLSRDEIVEQLASQGLGPREDGWLTIRIRGTVPQRAGTKYFVVCDRITENKAWFGEFAFAEEDPYEFGRHWLNPKHDLVLRTYVGKTEEQLKLIQVANQDEPKGLLQDEFPPEPISQNAREAPLPYDQGNTFTPGNASTKKNPLPSPNEGNQTKKKSMFDRLFRNKN
ncbi:MAG: hypothetical protein VXZ32_03960 [Verrucomicrobiota bacterium]|nr:hypothetical protein [Verrucomicrobiota bacterium]